MIDLVRTEATSTTSRAPWRELLLALCLWALVGARTVAGAPDVRILIARTGISKGICSVPQCGPGDLAAAIAAESELLVHAFDRDRADVDQAARRPKLLAVEWLATGRMPYVDDFVDLAVVDTAASGTPASEIFRVLRPRGCAILRGGSASAGDLATAGFEVETDIAVGPLAARIDQDAMTAVLVNLLDNAMKFSPDKRPITVSVGAREGGVEIVIKDRGVGIPAEHVEMVFQDFYRVESDLIKKTRGTGIGLALVREIVTVHSGKVWVDSTPGQGAEFTVRLPVVQESNEGEK